MKRLLCAVILAGIVSACGSDPAPPAPSPPPPAPPPVAACQTNNTATVFFSNRSVTNRTYDIVWDGARLTTVSPGQDTQDYTFAANVQHTLRFQFTNTTVLACNQSTPVLSTCASGSYSCGG